jgi:hypothetical protein
MVRHTQDHPAGSHVPVDYLACPRCRFSPKSWWVRDGVASCRAFALVLRSLGEAG